jgi:hypothetical protein
MQTHSHYAGRGNAALEMLMTPPAEPAAPKWIAPDLSIGQFVEIAIHGLIECYEAMPHEQRREFFQLKTATERLAALAAHVRKTDTADIDDAINTLR